MKKILLLIMLIISCIGANAQVTSCPGYTFTPGANIWNKTDCDITVTLFCVSRSNCSAPTTPTYTFTATAGVFAGYLIPTALLSGCNPGSANVIMAQFSWANSNCNQGPISSSVQVNGPYVGGTQCWSCGSFIGPGSGSTVAMPSCSTCDKGSTVNISWDALGSIIIQ